MIKAILKKIFGEFKPCNPTFHDYVLGKKQEIDDLRATIRPLIQVCMQTFANDPIISDVMDRLYRCSDHSIKIEFRFSYGANDCNKSDYYGFSLSERYCDLYFFLHDSLKLNDYDYMSVVVQELGAAVKPLGLIVKDGNLMPDNEKDKALATYCRKTYH